MVDWQNRLDHRFSRKDGKKDYCTCAPDKPLGVDIGEACRLHDFHIEHRKLGSRKAVDVRFREDIITISTLDNKRLRGLVIAYLYYLGVRMFGETQWQQ